MRASLPTRTLRLFLFVLLLGGTALARRPQDFQPGPERSAEEVQREKDASRSGLPAYGQSTEEKRPTFPWKALGLFGLALLIAAPFALRAYRSTAKELDSER